MCVASSAIHRSKLCEDHQRFCTPMHAVDLPCKCQKQRGLTYLFCLYDNSTLHSFLELRWVRACCWQAHHQHIHPSDLTQRGAGGSPTLRKRGRLVLIELRQWNRSGWERSENSRKIAHFRNGFLSNPDKWGPFCINSGFQI